MTIQPAAALADPLSAPSEDWVLSLSLDEPGRLLTSGVRWAEWGPFRGFFHGLLFDREDLAHSNNCSASDCSDAELVLRAYERGGEAALPRLRGSFVVAIVDRTRDTAILARDPHGTHPLFYVERGSRVLFATTPAPLLDQPGVSHALNRVALADCFCSRWPDPQETFFAAVRRVPAGCRVIVSGGSLRVAHYWSPDDQPMQWLTDEEAEGFDGVFNRAVERCLRHGPTGIFLSGGLDSISVAAVAADRARHIGVDPPLALSLGYTHPECDERERQKAVAANLGLRQHLVAFHEAIGSRPLLEQAVELNRGLAAPLLNAWQPAYLELARRGRVDGVLNIFTGAGGDEWLTVTPCLAADLISRGAFLEMAQFFGTLRRSYQAPTPALVRQAFWRFGLRLVVGRWMHRLMPRSLKSIRVRRLLAGDPSWVAPDPELRAMQRRRAEGALTDLDPPQGFYIRELKVSLQHPIVSWAIEESFQFGRRAGVRFLHPLWDPDVVEMLYRTPPSLLNQGGRAKGLVRQALSRRFPTLGLERQRKVLAKSFFESLLRQEWKALTDLIGDFPSLSGLGIVDGKGLRAFVDDAFQNPEQIRHCWVPINLEMWARSHHG